MRPVIVFFLLFCCGIARAQTVFNKELSAINYAFTSTVVQTPDGGYAATGLASNDSKSIFITRGAPNGATIWTVRLDSLNPTEVPHIVQTNNGDFVLSCITVPPTSNEYGLTLLKVDKDGNVTRRRTFRGNSSYADINFNHTIRQTADGGFIAPAVTASGSSLIKLNADLGLAWCKGYDFFAVLGFLKDVQQTVDGGYVFTGRAHISGGAVVVVVKTDAAGNVQWGRSYRNTFNGDLAYVIRQTADSGYIVGGQSGDFVDAGTLLLKLDKTGAIQWNKHHRLWVDAFEEVNDVLQVPGGYVCVGRTSNNGGDQAGFVIKTDDQGNALWARLYQEPGVPDGLYTIAPVYDGGLLLGGRSGNAALLVRTYNTGYSCEDADTTVSALNFSFTTAGYIPPVTDTLSLYVADTALTTTTPLAFTDICLISDVKTPSPGATLLVYPNPGKGLFVFESSTAGLLLITDMHGRTIHRQQLHNKATVDLSAFSSGVYIYSLVADGAVATTGKLVLL